MLLATALFTALLLPQAADPTLPPQSAKAVFTVEGRGVQIYTCMPRNNKLAWVFQAPEANLYDRSSHQQVGTHSAGPTWTWTDGSAITGKVIQTQPSSKADAIPSLLLETHATGSTTGALSNITLVRRSDTEAGAAPKDGCDAQHAGITLRVPYAAIYTFYTVQH